jgi:hypothetical protein
MVEPAVIWQFEMEPWKALQLRLEMWKQNVRGILEGLKQSVNKKRGYFATMILNVQFLGSLENSWYKNRL